MCVSQYSSSSLQALKLYPSQCSRFHCALHRGRHSAPDIIPQKKQTRAIYREKINLSTNRAHGGLKPALASSFSLPISGHQRESSSLGLGRTLRQGQKASSDQPSITDALQTLLIIQQQRGCISFEPSYDLHIKSILAASTLSYLNNHYQKIKYSGSFRSLELSCVSLQASCI